MSLEMGTSHRYIVITPCKNEGVNLSDLIESMVAQTVRPVVWVIVDDGSADDTPNIIESAMETQDWIQSIRLDSAVRDLGLHLAGVVKKGFDYAISYCEENGFKYNYLGNLDGDLSLPPTFYENLIREFEKDSTLGVASGGTKHIIGDRIVYAKVSANEPSGGHMLMRRECFDEIEGIPLSYATDSVIKAKARLRGWMTRRFEDNIATEIRAVHAAEGYWKGYMDYGRSDYYLNLNPVHAVIKGLIRCFDMPYYGGIAYLISYFDALVARKEQSSDREIRRYFWNKWKEHYKRARGIANGILK